MEHLKLLSEQYGTASEEGWGMESSVSKHREMKQTTEGAGKVPKLTKLLPMSSRVHPAYASGDIRDFSLWIPSIFAKL